MLKALKYILITGILLAIAWWVASLPGNVTAEAGRFTITTSTPASLLLLFLLVALLTITIRVIGGVRRVPGGFLAWRGGRRQKLGDNATERGIVALAAGDAKQAQTEAMRARKLIGDTPLVLLLTAESARLAGQAEQAKAAFTKLTRNKNMAFLGHRGLLRHAMDEQAHKTAQGHALAAADAYPNSQWLAAQRLNLAAKQRDWPAALALTKNPAETAALATQAARDATTQHQALTYAKQAVRAQPTLAPAVAAYAEALRAAGKPRAAKRALLAGWKAAPHPMLAEAFLNPLPTPIERAQAAGELAAANPGHLESELALAQTALAARLTGEARRHAEAAIAAGATDGRAEAVIAALDGKPAAQQLTPGWECSACHAAQTGWAALCANCQRIGTLAWRRPTSKALTTTLG